MSTRQIARMIPATKTPEGQGVTVYRSIGTPAANVLDPFLLLDEFVIEDANSGAGFPDHPHRGFETVTYMFDGLMTHGDNAGHGGTIGPGAAQWMTAGRGIVHSEIPAPDPNGDGPGVRGMQLWVNLPAAEKMTAPRYQDIDASEIPASALESGGSIRIVAGEYDGTAGPVNGIATAPTYLDISLQADEELTLPVTEGHSAFLYVADGSAKVAGQDAARRTLVVLGDGDEVELGAGPDGARVILVAAKPIGEPVARYGPFVMNTREEIMQAVDDYQSGKF